MICVHSILEHKAAQLYAGDAGAYVRATFRLVVFQPFEKEVLVGTIHKSSARGLVVTMDFFRSVFIPARNMPAECTFDAKEGLWVWNYAGQEFYLDHDDPMRFRVEEVCYLPFNARSSGAARAAASQQSKKPAAPLGVTSAASAAAMAGQTDGGAAAAGKAMSGATFDPFESAGPAGRATDGETLARVHGYRVTAAEDEVAKPAAGGAAGAGAGTGDASETGYAHTMRVIGSIADLSGGLGLMSWWGNAGQ